MAVLPTRPFQNQSYSIAAASAFGNSFYAPAYLSSSPASRRSLETRKKLPPETTPAFATLRTSSIIRSPPFRHSLFLNTPAFHRSSLRTESSLTKLRKNAFSLPFFALSNIPRVENRESKGGPPSSLELSRSMRFPARSKSNRGTRLEGGANSLSTRESSIKFLLPVLGKLQRTYPSSSRARMNWKRLGTLLHVAFDVFMYHLSVSVRLAPF